VMKSTNAVVSKEARIAPPVSCLETETETSNP
jgi:hypothetical protein